MADKEDTHPILRVSKWIGAVVGILSFVVASVTGIWRFNSLLDELSRAQADIASLRTSVEGAQADATRRSEIQEEILNNLRIAVASLQAVSEFQNRPAAPISTPHRSTHVPTGAATATSLTRSERLRARPPLPAATLPEASTPEVEALFQSLPPLPADTDLSESRISGYSAPSPDFSPDLASERTDVALERAEILQGQL